MRNKIKEKLLVYRVQVKRDAQAFAEIYDYYIEKIHRFIFFKVASEQEAEDLSSEVFLKAWNYLSSDKGVKSMGALLYTIARNSVIDHWRGKKIELDLEQAFLKDELLEPAAISELEQDADMTRVYKALAKLKDEYREVIVMRYLDQMDVGEISNILQKNKNNIRVLLHRSLTALRQTLEEQENK
ncbi:sigma-70 family RNA polymerase sigma factor [Patescibacteria group bacterium]|nr:sigma-70 family RNA polymerase sigma factor [Patescibacteria group bacterium]MBU1922132.1 sigma-70 family RNA polymerase sigma factor [Patescibacteria group bacterium]